MKRFTFVTILLLLAMVLTACGPKATPEPTPAPAPTTAPAAPVATTAPAAPAPAAGGKEAAAATAKGLTELAAAYSGQYKGTKVTMEGPFTDNDALKFDESVKAFEAATGIDIQYTGSKEFEASITIKVEGGSAPDIVDFPQPGLLANLAKKGLVIDLANVINAGWLKENYSSAWLNMGVMPGKAGPITGGIWARANGKSLVWYPKKAFDAAGYKVPTTWDELLKLSDEIKADGDAPWCVGIESGAATGWPMTDWIEEMMLRTTSPQNYDKWVAGELKFDSPEVRKAVATVEKIWFTDGYVYGGRGAIATTSFGDAPKPMFENPPKCWLHKQGNFITTFFPEGLVAGVDYDFFYLPGVDPAYGSPVLGAGDIYAMFSDRPEVRAVMQFFSTGASVEGWVKAGGAISPHRDASLDWYQDPVSRKVAEVLQNATTFRFDGSDLMPGAVGAGSFWKSMTSYVTQAITLDTALKDIDASWPASAAAKPAAPAVATGASAEGATAKGLTELAAAYSGQYKGTKVTMEGPFTDNDALKFDESVKAFEAATGIDIQYTGSKEFEASITIKVEGGSAPDIVDFPQPGLLANLAKKGLVIDLANVINAGWLKENYSSAWLNMGVMPGKAGPITGGIWARANGKSLVWYPKKAFDAAGYKVPTTWDELLKLSDEIKADGDAPWCVGIESGAATGWPMTDWIEEMMLRTTSPQNYDKWVAGELKFDSPEVRKAVATVEKIWFTDGYVYGGRGAIATTSFGDAPKPMFENPPKCWLHKQGNFITTFFPEGLVAGVDYDFFYLPGVDPAYGSPVLGAGDIYAMFSDRPEVRAVMQFFSTGASVEGWVKAGGAISPHRDASLDWYQDPVSRKVAEVLQNATTFRFDGSDLMPGAVGAGSFWKSMTSYVTQAITLDTALKDIDASWPK